jgi:hypothetical protein
VIALQAELVDRAMAQRTLLVPGVLLLVGDDRVDRCGAVVADVAEGLGYENAPRDDEAYHCQEKNDRQAGNLLGNHGRPNERAH